MTDVESLVREYARQCPPITVTEVEAHLELNGASKDTGVDRFGDVTEVQILGDADEEPAPERQGRRYGVVLSAVAATILLIIGVAVAIDGERADEPPPPLSSVDATERAASLQWSRLPHDEAVFGGRHDLWISDVTVGGPGMVAVGSLATANLYGSMAAAVWTSVDGERWSRVPHDESVFGGVNDRAMTSVAAVGTDLVAVGSTTFPYKPSSAAVWTSEDGVRWSPVPHDEAVFGGVGDVSMNSVVAGGPGVVAVGTDGSGAAVWTSVDGSAWSRVPHDDAVFGRRDANGLGMTSVTVGGPGLVAVGSRIDDPDAAVWTSVDGITWSRVSHDEAVFGGGGAVFMWSVTAGGPGLVAVGSAGHYAVHLGDGPLQAHAVVWTSVDGITWSRVPHDPAVFGDMDVVDQWMHSVTTGGPGLVAVGGPSWASRYNWYAADNPVQDANAVVWTSEDGITWSRVADEVTEFGTEPYQWMHSVTAGGPGLVAVGSSRSDDVDAVIWVAATDD